MEGEISPLYFIERIKMAIHNTLTDPELHEPKGISTANPGEVYVCTAPGTGAWTTLDYPLMGWYDYNDLATVSTPISVPLTTWTPLTNDGAGPQTEISYGLPCCTNMWNVSTNRFDFSTLNIGDTVDIRLSFSVTTGTASQVVQCRLSLGEGSGSPYTIPFTYANYKSAGTYENIRFSSIYMGNTITKDYPAFFEIWSDANASVTVTGWYIRVIKRAEV